MKHSHRFTALGNTELEARIARDLERIAEVAVDRVGERFHALVLGGGYGRGEGGGRQRDGAWEPYNDYDLFLIMEGLPAWQRSSMRSEMAAVGRSLEEDLGLEVELSAIRIQDVGKLPFTMMWCELVGGHHVVRGCSEALHAAPEMSLERLPLFEGVHYLSNRAALILWSLVEDLGKDRTWKFIHKAWLAVGAAALIGERRFRIGYDRRLQALEDHQPEALAGISMLLDRYREAAHARQQPAPAPAAEVVDERREEVTRALLRSWRWLEELRLDTRYTNFEQYALLPNLLEKSWSRWPMNTLRHVRLLGGAGLQPLFALTEHPRTRAIRAIPALLERRQPSPEFARLVGGGRDWSTVAKRCLDLWRRC